MPKYLVRNPAEQEGAEAPPGDPLEAWRRRWRASTTALRPRGPRSSSVGRSRAPPARSASPPKVVIGSCIPTRGFNAGGAADATAITVPPSPNAARSLSGSESGSWSHGTGPALPYASVVAAYDNPSEPKPIASAPLCGDTVEETEPSVVPQETSPSGPAALPPQNSGDSWRGKSARLASFLSPIRSRMSGTGSIPWSLGIPKLPGRRAAPSKEAAPTDYGFGLRKVRAGLQIGTVLPLQLPQPLASGRH